MLKGFLARSLPCLALILNAFVWGSAWWPLRELQLDGLHALWASSVTYGVGVIWIVLIRPTVVLEFLHNKGLWVLALAAGCTMVGFNWGVTIADIIRVVLLFYLMPIWAVFLARFVLNERITGQALGRVVMACVGAVLVLSPQGRLGFPLPTNFGECLGLFGGAAFALNNIMLRKQANVSSLARLFGMFVGGVLVPTCLAAVLVWGQWGDAASSMLIQWPSVPSVYGLGVLALFSVCVLCANYALQFGASRLPANIAAVVMLSEVIFATIGAIVFNQEQLTLQVALGGGLIVLAAALSALSR